MTPHDLVLFLRWRYDPRYSDASDGALLEQYFAARDELALRALVSRHAGPLFNLCRVELGDLDAAEDAFQDTIVALHRRGRSLRNKQAVLAWLMTTARRICVRKRSQRDRRFTAEQRAARSLSIGDAAEEVNRADQRRFIAEAIGKLPDRYGVPLHLGLHGLSAEQIGEALNVPVPTVKTRITRGRKLLLAKLQAEGIGAAVAGVVLAERSDAAPRIALVAAAIKAAVTDVGPALGLVASAWWLKPALGVLMVGGVAAGGIAWSTRAPDRPKAEPTVVRETVEERDLRLLQTEVAPMIVEALKPLLIGGGEIRVVKCELLGTVCFCELEAAHKLGFRSVLNFRYQTLNGGLLIGLDQFANGQWKVIDPVEPIRIGEKGQNGFIPISLESTRYVFKAFSAIPVRIPPIVFPGREAGVSPIVLPFLGTWRYQNDRRWPVDIIYIDAAGQIAHVDRLGRFDNLKVEIRADFAPMLQAPSGERQALVGQRLCQVGSDSDWWDPVEHIGPPP